MNSGEIIKNIEQKAEELGRPMRFMELCGTHSGAIAEYGIKQILPKNIKLVSGPGCPVCVTDQEDVDVVVGLALAGVPIAAYGDSIGVPGNIMSLEQARQNGADVSVVYDVTQALELAKTKKNLVFWGIGFETTAPMTAWGVKNKLTVFSSHKIFPPAMKALMDGKIDIDGFIDPGHVSAIIGTKEYEKFKIPQVVAGFSQENILLAVSGLLDQIILKKPEVKNVYKSVVREEGNKKAIKLINEVFENTDAKWRGLGVIKNSGLKIKKKYQTYDAEVKYADLIKNIRKNIKVKPSACRCGEILLGKIEPADCPLYKKVCRPDSAQGACMVSVEGTCNVAYRYDG